MKRNPDKLIRKFLGIGSDNLMGQEPTYLGFAIKFDFENVRDKADINHIIPGLLLDDDDLDSSINYLRRIGQELRSNYLVEFIKQLKDIQDNKPWYFQSITGLEEIWKRPDGPENTVTYHDLSLTIECLESLDLQMTFLAMLYNKAKEDATWQRNLLPLEKRKFHARIIVCEIRNLNKVKEQIEKADALVSDIGKETPSSFLGGIDSVTSSASKFSGGLVGNSDLAQTYAKNKMSELDSNGAVGVNTGDTSGMSTVDWQYLEDKYGSSNKLMVDPSKAFSNLGGDIYDGITSYGEPDEVSPSPKFNAFERGGQENYSSLDNKYNSLVDLLESLDDYISVLVYDLYNCEFDFNSLPYTDSVSASTFPEAAKFKFDIMVGDASMIGKFGFFKWIVATNMSEAAAPPDFVSKEPFDQQDYEKMSSSYSRDGFFTMNDRRVAEDKEISKDSVVDDTFTAKAAKFGGRFGKNQLDKMRGKVNGIVGDMTRESVDYLKNIEDTYNSKRMQVTNTVKSLYDSIDLSNPESILDAYRKTKDELYGTTSGEFGKADENAIENALTNSGLGNAYDLNSDSITTKMTAERDLNYRLLRKFKDSETGEDRYSKNIGDTGTKPQDAPEDLKFGKLRINENGVGIPNVGLDAPNIRTDINKINFSSNGHLTIVEPSNVGLNGVIPNNSINNITLDGADPIVGITPDPLEGAEPSNSITPDPLEGADPMVGITPDPLEGADPMVGITPDPLTGAKPMDGPIPITLEGAPPMVGITPDPLTGAKPMKGPIPITLEGTPPMVGITPDPLTGAKPMKGPIPITLEGTPPMVGITPDPLTGAKPMKGPIPITLEGTPPLKGITPDKLEGARPMTGITPDKLEGAKTDNKITPIKIEGVKTDNKITPIKIEGVKTDNKITQIELTGVGKNDSKNIGKVDMEIKTSNIAINPIKLEGIPTKDVNTIGKIDFDLVKNDSKIEKLDLIAPNVVKDITPIKLEGPKVETKITEIELTASKVLGSSDITDIKLEGSESNTKITKITLEPPSIKTDITPIKFENVDVKTEITPIELKGAESTTTITNIKLEGQKSNTKITNSELTGVSPKDASTLGSISFENNSTKTQISKNELTGSTPNTKITQSKLIGSNNNSKITQISFDSAGKKGADGIGSFKLEGKKSNTSISELTFNDIKKNDKKLDNINLVGADKKTTIGEIKLEGSKPETKITQISFNSNVPNNSINGIELKGTASLTGKDINNIELTGVTKNETISIHKVFDNKPDSNITISNSNILENDTVKNNKKVTQDKLEGATIRQTTPNNINDKEVNIDKNINTENIGYSETPHLTDISNRNIYDSNVQTSSSKIIQDPLDGAKPVSRITQDPLEGAKPSTNITPDPLSGAKPVSRITQDPLEGAKPSTNITPDPLSGAKPSTNIIPDPLSGAKPVSRITQDPLEGAKSNNKISQDY